MDKPIDIDIVNEQTGGIKKYYKANKEKLLEQNKKYREENKEKESKRAKKYREANKEIILEKEKKYREENKEKERKRAKKYNKANKEKLSERRKRDAENLTDYYVVRFIIENSNLTPKDIPQELIEAKRELIKINRFIKKENQK